MVTSAEAPGPPYGILPFDAPGPILAALEPGVFAPLVSESAYRRISTLAADIRYPVKAMLFECRLAAGDSRVDMALCLMPRIDYRDGIADLVREEPGCRTSQGARALGFLEDWVSGRLPVGIPFLWCAYDLPSLSDSDPLPCFSLVLDPDVPFWNRPSSMRILESVCDYHARLMGAPLPPETAARITACLGALGEHGFPKHISWMLSRDPVPLKLDVRLPLSSVEGFLARMEWTGAIRGLQVLLGEFAPGDPQLQLNLQLGEPHAPALEVEFHTGGRREGLWSRSRFLERLVVNGLCDAGKAEALREAYARPMLREFPSHFLGRSWYAKLRIERGIPTQAKAYYGLIPKPR